MFLGPSFAATIGDSISGSDFDTDAFEASTDSPEIAAALGYSPRVPAVRHDGRSRVSRARTGLLTVAIALVGLFPGERLAAARARHLQEASTGENYRVVQWTTAEGLPQNTINDLLILPNGEMWLATFGGLVRFDGSVFKVLDVAADEGIPANRIVALAPEGEASFLFLSQEGHLGRVERGRASLLVPPPMATLEALELTVDPAGRAYCRSSDGRVWRTEGRQPWTRVRHAWVGSQFVQALVLQENGEVWAQSERGLVNLGDPSAEGIPLTAARMAMAPRAGGGLWLGLKSGVGYLADGDMGWLEIQPPFAADILDVTPAGDRSLWVATADSVSRVEPHSDGTWKRTRLPLGLPTPFPVRSMLHDRHGAVWVGVAGAGLFRVNRVPGRRLAVGLGAVGGLTGDGRGGGFVDAGCGNLYHVDSFGAMRAIDHGVAHPPCQISLARGDDDSVWARVGPDLMRVHGRSLKARTLTTGLPSEEGAIAVNADGSIWVISRGGVVQHISPQGRVLHEFSLPSPLVSAVVGPDHALWIGGDGEVFRVLRGEVSRFGQQESVPRGQVRDIVPEPDGTVWLGTYGGGVGRLRGGQAARLTVDQGLPDNAVSRMLADGRGRLWISTNRGVVVVDRSALEDVADGRARALAPVLLGEERGVPEANFGSPAGFAGEDGRLWFGTIDGVVVIDANAFPFNTTPPVARIEEVRTDGGPLTPGSVVQVPPLTARVRIGFTAFELHYPERLMFRFRFEGVDPDWVDAGPDRLVDWTPPGPGRHRFLVDVRNEDGIWSRAPAVVELQVLPAWWQATASRGAAALAVVLLAVAGVRARIGAIERRHEDRLRAMEERRQAEERMGSVRAQLEHVSRAALAGELAASIAHEVRQPIGAIVNNAEAGNRHLAQYLQRPAELEQLFADIVEDAHRASQVVQGLRGFLRARGPEAASLDLSALVLEVLPVVRREIEDRHVKVELALADDLPPVEGLRVQLGQIIVNLVVNACEALSGVAGERRIGIETSSRDGHVDLVVRDNGPGVAADVAARLFEPFVTTKPEGLGVGLAICRSIAERHGGRLSAESPPSGGASMTLTLPAARPAGERSWATCPPFMSSTTMPRRGGRSPGSWAAPAIGSSSMRPPRNSSRWPDPA